MSVKLAVYSAELCLDKYEAVYPNDKGSRNAIESAKAWLRAKGKGDSAASNAAESAAFAAAFAAANAAANAAWRASSVASNAAWRAAAAANAASNAVWSAAERAANAAESTTINKINTYLLSLCKWRTK
jgi:hypothetical protein